MLVLREFVLNSRHPGPRRVWKVGSVAHWLPPQTARPGRNGSNGSVSQTVVWCTQNTTFPSPKALESLPGQGLARGSPMGAKGAPKGPQREPKVTPEEPKKPKVGPEGPQRTAKGIPKSPQGSKRNPKVRKSAQRDPKGRPKGVQSHPRGKKGPQHGWDAERKPTISTNSRSTAKRPLCYQVLLTGTSK